MRLLPQVDRAARAVRISPLNLTAALAGSGWLMFAAAMVLVLFQ